MIPSNDTAVLLLLKVLLYTAICVCALNGGSPCFTVAGPFPKAKRTQLLQGFVGSPLPSLERYHSTEVLNAGSLIQRLVNIQDFNCHRF